MPLGPETLIRFEDSGTDPSTEDPSKFTPIHYAAKEGNFSVAELLLKYGTDPNAKEKSGLTSLHYAAQDGHDEMPLEYWADPSSQNNSGLTPLHLAVKGDRSSTVKLFLDAGADKEVQDNEGNTPLHLATDLSSVRLLLEETDITTDPNIARPLRGTFRELKDFERMRFEINKACRHKM